jgi:predicted transcriptional regulator
MERIEKLQAWQKALRQRVAQEGIVIEVCPTSNLHTNAGLTLQNHPFRVFLKDGIRFSVSVDNSTTDNVIVSDEMLRLANAKNLTMREFTELIIRSSAYGMESLPKMADRVNKPSDLVSRAEVGRRRFLSDIPAMTRDLLKLPNVNDRVAFLSVEQGKYVVRGANAFVQDIVGENFEGRAIANSAVSRKPVTLAVTPAIARLARGAKYLHVIPVVDSQGETRGFITIANDEASYLSKVSSSQTIDNVSRALGRSIQLAESYSKIRSEYTGANNPVAWYGDTAQALRSGKTITRVIVNLRLKAINLDGHLAGNAYLTSVFQDVIQRFASQRGIRVRVYRRGPNFEIDMPTEVNVESFMKDLYSELTRKPLRFSFKQEGTGKLIIREVSLNEIELKPNIGAWQYDPARDGTMSVRELRIASAMRASELNRGEGNLQLTRVDVEEVRKYSAEERVVDPSLREKRRISDAWKPQQTILEEAVRRQMQSEGIKNPTKVEVSKRVRMQFIEPDSGLFNYEAYEVIAKHMVAEMRKNGSKATVGYIDGNKIGAFIKSYGFLGDVMVDTIICRRLSSAAAEIFARYGIVLARHGSGSEEFYLIGNVDAKTMKVAMEQFNLALRDAIKFRVLLSELKATPEGRMYLKRESYRIEKDSKGRDVVVVDLTKLPRGEGGQFSRITFTGAITEVVDTDKNAPLEKVVEKNVGKAASRAEAAKIANVNREPLLLLVEADGSIKATENNQKEIAKLTEKVLVLTEDAKKSGLQIEVDGNKIKLVRRGVAVKTYSINGSELVKGQELKEGKRAFKLWRRVRHRWGKRVADILGKKISSIGTLGLKKLMSNLKKAYRGDGVARAKLMKLGLTEADVANLIAEMDNAVKRYTKGKRKQLAKINKALAEGKRINKSAYGIMKRQLRSLKKNPRLMRELGVNPKEVNIMLKKLEQLPKVSQAAPASTLKDSRAGRTYIGRVMQLARACGVKGMTAEKVQELLNRLENASSQTLTAKQIRSLVKALNDKIEWLSSDAGKKWMKETYEGREFARILEAENAKVLMDKNQKVQNRAEYMGLATGLVTILLAEKMAEIIGLGDDKPLIRFMAVLSSAHFTSKALSPLFTAKSRERTLINLRKAIRALPGMTPQKVFAKVFSRTGMNYLASETAGMLRGVSHAVVVGSGYDIVLGLLGVDRNSWLRHHLTNMLFTFGSMHYFNKKIVEPRMQTRTLPDGSKVRVLPGALGVAGKAVGIFGAAMAADGIAYQIVVSKPMQSAVAQVQKKYGRWHPITAFLFHKEEIHAITRRMTKQAQDRCEEFERIFLLREKAGVKRDKTYYTRLDPAHADASFLMRYFSKPVFLSEEMQKIAFKYAEAKSSGKGLNQVMREAKQRLQTEQSWYRMKSKIGFAGGLKADADLKSVFEIFLMQQNLLQAYEVYAKGNNHAFGNNFRIAEDSLSTGNKKTIILKSDEAARHFLEAAAKNINRPAYRRKEKRAILAARQQKRVGELFVAALNNGKLPYDKTDIEMGFVVADGKGGYRLNEQNSAYVAVKTKYYKNLRRQYLAARTLANSPKATAQTYLKFKTLDDLIKTLIIQFGKKGDQSSKKYVAALLGVKFSQVNARLKQFGLEKKTVSKPIKSETAISQIQSIAGLDSLSSQCYILKAGMLYGMCSWRRPAGRGAVCSAICVGTRLWHYAKKEIYGEHF